MQPPQYVRHLSVTLAVGHRRRRHFRPEPAIIVSDQSPGEMEPALMTDATQILRRIELGDSKAAEELLPLVYNELRRLAAQKLAHENPGQTLQATALVHEAYIRLVGANEVQHWDSCRHFFAAAAEAMRRILIERARRKRSAKCGGMVSRDDVDVDRLCTRMTSEELIDLDAALNELAQDHPEKARLVTLRYFGGFNVEQCCEILQISRVYGPPILEVRPCLAASAHDGGSTVE